MHLLSVVLRRMIQSSSFNLDLRIWKLLFASFGMQLTRHSSSSLSLERVSYFVPVPGREHDTGTSSLPHDDATHTRKRWPTFSKLTTVP
jgi:hypothetical protein